MAFHAVTAFLGLATKGLNTVCFVYFYIRCFCFLKYIAIKLLIIENMLIVNKAN